MPRVVFIDSLGVVRFAQACEGETAMELARKAGIPEISGDCGGSAACACCHVYLEEGSAGQVSPPQQRELTMLEIVECRRTNSRLSCQISLTHDLDGLRLRTVPAKS